MSKICLCLTATTLARNLEILDKYRPFIDIAELRVDCLDKDERFLIRRFPEQAGLPVVLTVRRRIDGGMFQEGEGARITLLASGLAWADSDRRRNFAYVDLEEDTEVPSLEEAARAFGTRIIRSVHDFTGVPENLSQRIRQLRRNGDEIVKMAVMPSGIGDLSKIFRAARECQDIEKIVVGMGPYGQPTRILANKLGSCISYASPLGEEDIRAAAPGQVDPVEMAKLYRFHSIDEDTKIFGIIGLPLTTTSSPSIHNLGYEKSKFNAVYLPFKCDSVGDFFYLADKIGIQGASVTIPWKEEVLPFLRTKSDTVELIGSCNTLVRESTGWHGYNTDALGFSQSLLSAMGVKHLRGLRVTVIGAGGVACAVVSELKRLGARALILNRSVLRAKNLAHVYDYAWAGLDERGIAHMEKFRDIIIQTTSVGMGELENLDPVPLYRFAGREVAMDLIYKPEKTLFLQRAEAAGCLILNGRDMLERQARFQYELFTGGEYPD